jgi:hypothetical protein
MKDKDLDNIIKELQSMPLSGNLSPDEATAQQKRLDEIEAAIRAKTAKLPPHLRGIFEGMTRRGQR